MSIEYVLLVKQQQVCLFKIPPVSTIKGHYLDDWKEMFWEGGIKLTEKGGLLTLYFIDKNTSAVQTFVNLPDNPYLAIEKTVDRYAVRLVTPTGGHQWVGCVFRDRNDAFDFNEKILKFISDREMERNPEKFKNEFQPTQDFSLKQGQKIQISLGEGNEQKKQTQQKGEANLSQFKFAPPPDAGDFGQFSQPVKQQPTQTVQNSWGNFDFNSWNQPSVPQQNAFQQAPPQQQQQFGFGQQNQSQPQQQFNPQPQAFTIQSQPQQQNQAKTKELNLLDI
ncbi:unnamed protein product (macronuclear) [Paramecium tetraurelia]|uniref:NECAP PHear domain-containing protein n=1 Tax=Paramecium tetraurelia TaxID=5888 RepID=A0E647_PARTE|nr:uncharacterized protein GSPATT00003627001 [Paramecium tetraurelia]CAK90764.1 unnamed protein product [Paramecium tetraurelia]|eukprot:XP_001458161.1 hypothetical protein (macronuclear) [Paramecium tetraurelia strain d4-2]